MTAIDQVVGNIENYYDAQYNPTQRAIVSGYLARVDRDLLESICDHVFRMPMYGRKLPIVEHFEAAAQLAIMERGQREEAQRLARLAIPAPVDTEGEATQAEKLEFLRELKAKRIGGLVLQVLEDCIGADK